MLNTVLLLCSTSIYSHPHNWIDLYTEININDQGQLTGFTQHWQFDQFFSMISYAELMNEYNDEAIGLASTALTMVANVGPDQYFSELIVDGKKIELPVPKLYSLETIQVNDSPVLVLKMEFSLKEQPLMKKKTLVLQTFEPTYFVAMNYLSNKDIKINSPNLSCNSQLIEANPSEEIISYASGLDRSIRDTDGLGDNFAERVKIQC